MLWVKQATSILTTPVMFEAAVSHVHFLFLIVYLQGYELSLKTEI